MKFTGIAVSGIAGQSRRYFLEHFNFQIVYNDEMLWWCEAKRSNTREIGVGGVAPPLSDNLKAKLL